MAEKQVLKRLLQIRELEEDQSRLELEVAVAKRNRIEQERRDVENLRVQGRRSFVEGIGEKDTAGRTGGMMEMEQARRLRMRIEMLLEAADVEVGRRREEYLTRRTGRRQVETLMENARKQAEIDAGRRAQQIVDDWYGRKRMARDTRGPAPITSGIATAAPHKAVRTEQ